ncbi:hypothetical protein [Clostridium omnivorum]|uniref:Intracellular proteinase inhibitor BsuPI domain-containing protein n=1 Tax=Clostridium omnivorum TaxID=1604902 RepID=A0ABQ5N9K0_9CLOT|nr:hypothetical protein [Clostridium sp. E14]GLC31779.1 hypothetical protein bsdE14_31890 [Clostridium sp. E14]
MRFKKYISIILISVFICSLSGCSDKNKQASINTDVNKNIEVTISSEINEYSPLMSSVPGIPLNIKFKENTTGENMKFHWITEQGTFLNWQQDNGKISVLGKDIKINDKKIYWSIDPKEKINKSSFKIYLKVENKDASKVIYETSIEVLQNKEGTFSIKK